MNELDTLREKMDKFIENCNFDMSNEELIIMSQKLDVLIVKNMKNKSMR
jgi:hypothetical protein